MSQVHNEYLFLLSHNVIEYDYDLVITIHRTRVNSCAQVCHCMICLFVVKWL